MLNFRKSAGIAGWALQGARLWLALALFFMTILQGMTFCLCQSELEGCGEHGHDCGSVPEPDGPHLDHRCEHLTISELALEKAARTASLKMTDFLCAEFLAPLCPCVINATVLIKRLRIARPPEALFPQLQAITRSTQLLC